MHFLVTEGHMHFLVTDCHISTCHFQVDALSNHKMVLVAAGEAHSGAVDMNGSLEQRFRVFHDVFRWVLDKLGILVRKHMESVAVFGRLQEDFFVKSYCNKKRVTCLGFGPPAEDRYICGVWVPMAVWDWERSWMFHWPGGSRGFGWVRSAGKTDSWMFKILGLDCGKQVCCECAVFR